MKAFVGLFLWIVVTVAGGPLLAADEAGPPPIERVGDEAYRTLVALFDVDRTIPLESRIVERIERDGVIREKIVFRGAQGFLVPGYLERPDSGNEPRPCVLLLHGWSGSKESWQKRDNYISGGNIREALLERGFALFAIDAQCHGDRIAVNDYAPVNHYVAPGPQPRKGYLTQREIYIQTVADCRRAVDFLQSRPEIDGERIGLVGYSMGGTQAFLLTAVDPRIKAAVACATPVDRNKWSPIAPQNYARGIGDRPFLMIMGSSDPMCPVESARQLHEMLNAETSQLLFFDGGHRLTSDFVSDAIEWIERNL